MYECHIGSPTINTSTVRRTGKSQPAAQAKQRNNYGQPHSISHDAQRKSEGLRAFAQSLSTDGLGVIGLISSYSTQRSRVVCCPTRNWNIRREWSHRRALRVARDMHHIFRCGQLLADCFRGCTTRRLTPEKSGCRLWLQTPHLHGANSLRDMIEPDD